MSAFRNFRSSKNNDSSDEEDDKQPIVPTPIKPIKYVIYCHGGQSGTTFPLPEPVKNIQFLANPEDKTDKHGTLLWCSIEDVFDVCNENYIQGKSYTYPNECPELNLSGEPDKDLNNVPRFGIYICTESAILVLADLRQTTYTTLSSLINDVIIPYHLANYVSIPITVIVQTCVVTTIWEEGKGKNASVIKYKDELEKTTNSLSNMASSYNNFMDVVSKRGGKSKKKRRSKHKKQSTKKNRKHINKSRRIKYKRK